MARQQLCAAALLSLLAVASAAHKPGGGSTLHAISFGATLSTNNYVYPARFPGLITPGTTTPTPKINPPPFYSATNGNGSWTVALGADLNPALYTAMEGAAGANGAAVLMGLTSVVFPSQKLGVVVGAGFGFGTSSTPVWPNVLTTVDFGLTWQPVTGFSGAPVGALVSGNCSGTSLASCPRYALPDLSAVSCAGTSLCFAVGGYYPATASFTGVTFNGLSYAGAFTTATTSSAYTNNNITFNTAVSFPATVCPASVPAVGTPAPGCGGSNFNLTTGMFGTYGAVYVSTNGATQWTSINVGTISALNAVASDISGMHVVAVGHPVGVSQPNRSTLTSLPLTFYSTQPTIIYSGNYGQTWVNQTAPVIPGAFYVLNTVYVNRGTIAFAAGGNPFAQNGIGALAQFSYGTIIATFNGGFTWSQQPISSFSTSANASTGNSPLSSGATIPVINSISFNTPARTSATGAVGTYVGWAVGENGLILKSAGIPMRTPASTNAVGARATMYPWTAVAVYPAALTYPSIPQLVNFPSTNSLYTIMWDNNLVGYILGYGVILSTHNGGSTWQVETPVLGSAMNAQFGFPATLLPTTV